MDENQQATIQDLLDELEDMLDKAARVPLSGGRCMVDSGEAKQIIAELREAVPSEVRQARAIVADRTQILSGAKREAETMMRVADEKAKAMINQDEITRQAQLRANELLTQTQQRVREMRKASNDYIDDLMKRTDDALAETLTELRKTRQNIRQSQK